MRYDFVFFGAHPDDVLLACGGTIGKLSSLGYKCMIVSLSAGENGCKNLGTVRKEELRKSVELLKSNYCVLNFIDTNITNTYSGQNLLKTLIEEWNPRFIFYHNPQDIHFDHAATSDIVKKSIALYLSSKNVDAPLLKGCFCYQIIKINEATLLYNEFNYFCDITEYMWKKEKALIYHESQLPYVKNNFEIVKKYNNLLGKIVGYEYAECFKYQPLSYTNGMLPIESLFE